MSKGGSSDSVEQTVRNEPPSIVKPYLTSMYQRANTAGQNALPYYPTQTFANFTPMQESGMFGNLDYAQNYMFPATMGYQQSLADYMDAPMNIASNPAVTGMMDANRMRAVQALQEDMLPAIRGGAIAAGQLGGSRQGIAEGQAVGRTMDALTQANAQTMLGALDPMTRLAGFASSAMPGALQMGFTPGDLAMQYGGAYQGQQQQAIDEAMQRYYYPEQKAWETLQQQNAIYSGVPWGQTTTGEQAGASPLAGAVGGGLLGASLSSAPFFSAGGTGAALGTAMGGWALPLLGAGLGFLTGR